MVFYALEERIIRGCSVAATGYLMASSMREANVYTSWTSCTPGSGQMLTPRSPQNVDAPAGVSECETTEAWPNPCQLAIQACKSTVEKWDRGAFARFSLSRQNIRLDARRSRGERPGCMANRFICLSRVLLHMAKALRYGSFRKADAHWPHHATSCTNGRKPTLFARLNAVTPIPKRRHTLRRGLCSLVHFSTVPQPSHQRLFW